MCKKIINKKMIFNENNNLNFDYLSILKRNKWKFEI